MVIDPFLGSGNQLYHLAKITKAAAAFGFDNNPYICAQTDQNFKKLNFHATCACADYTSVSKFIQPSSKEKQLFLIHLAPPWAGAFSYCTGLNLNKTSPPLNSLVEFYREQFADKLIVFLIIILEKIDEHSMKDLLNYSAFNETLWVKLSEHNTNLGCLVLEPKVIEHVGRRLTFQGYKAAFGDFRSRCDAHDVMKNWFLSYVKDSHLTVRKILFVGPGPAVFETMLARNMPDLTTVHCVEPNVHFIPEFWENLNNISVDDKQLFLLGFEDFHYNGTLYDIILISHSLYYMDKKMQQLTKAQQSLLSNNGSIIIFHEAVPGCLTDLQKIFSVHDASYNSENLEHDLSCCAIQYKKWLLKSFTNTTNPTENLFNFFLERYTNESEKEQLEQYFREHDNLLSTPVVAIVIKNYNVSSNAIQE